MAEAKIYELRRVLASTIYEYRKVATVPKTLFGKRLRQARERAGISQEKLGALIGLDEGTSSARISRYETGTHAPLFEVAQLMAKALDLPTAYFYCDDDLLASQWLERRLIRSQR